MLRILALLKVHLNETLDIQGSEGLRVSGAGLEILTANLAELTTDANIVLSDVMQM